MAKSLPPSTSPSIIIGSNGNLIQSPTIFTPTIPTTKPILRDVSAGFSSIVQIATDVLINPDIAYRSDRRLQEQMIRDPIIMGPLLERKLSVAQLEFQVVPADEDGDQDTTPTVLTEDKPFFPSLGGNYDEKEMAKKIERIIRKMMRRQDFFMQLLWADFRGTGVSEMNWEWEPTERLWYVKNSIPQHGDSITYDVWGNPRILTRLYQTGGRELTREERDRLVIHTYQPDMGSFYNGEEAGYRYKGRGLRDIVWPYWWLAHNALRFWVRFIQRYGMGFVLGKYPQGNKEAKDAIESVLRNLIEDSMVSVPVPGDAIEKEIYGIEIVNNPGVAEKASVFKEFVEDWAAKHIRMIIVGQEQAHQESGDGLGGGRAKALKDTFLMYRNHSAISLADTLTEQLVKPIVRFNFGDIPVNLKFAFILEEEDYEAEAARVTAAKDAGIQVGKAWVYKTLDIPMPLPGEEIIDFKPPPPVMNPGFGDENNIGDDGADESRRMFREAIGTLKYFDPSEPRRSDGEWTKGGSNPSQKNKSNTQKTKKTEPIMRPSAKAIMAKKTSRFVGADIQRYSEEHCESQLAKTIGGVSLRDSEPVDVLVTRDGRVVAGVELKTMTDNKQNKIYMKKSAISKKIKWMRENRAEFHTIVYDDQKVYNANGPGQHGDIANRVIYYRRGFGSFRVGNMHQVKNSAELKSLMQTKTNDLPDAAKPSAYYPRISK